MKYSPEELKELLEKAPTDEKGRPIISDEDNQSADLNNSKNYRYC